MHDEIKAFKMHFVVQEGGWGREQDGGRRGLEAQVL